MRSESAEASAASPEPAAPGTDPFVGTVLAGAYRITRMIAAGGMGRVYEATHLRLERRLVVKTMLELHAFKPEIVERAEREARAIAAIESEHVVQVVDLLKLADGRPAIVVDFLEGEDLGTRLERVGKLSAADAAAILRQACAGIAAAHAVGVVHRDLKPSNIFLVKRPEGEVVKILDFGVAKVEGHDELTATGAIVGTPGYMAPEQAMSAGAVDSRADIYALGGVLYHMLTGTPPYGREDVTTTLMMLLQGEPPRARSIEKSIPEELEAVIERAMARDPSQRTATAQQLAAELLPFEHPSSPTRRDPTAAIALGEAARPATNAKWARTLTALMTVGVTLGAAGWAAAVASSIVVGATTPTLPTDLHRALMIVAPVIAALGVGIPAARALAERWRSLPRVETLRAALGGALSWGLSALAILELALVLRAAVAFAKTGPSYFEHAGALAVAALVALVAFFVTKGRG